MNEWEKQLKMLFIDNSTLRHIGLSKVPEARKPVVNHTADHIYCPTADAPDPNKTSNAT